MVSFNYKPEKDNQESNNNLGKGQYNGKYIIRKEVHDRLLKNIIKKEIRNDNRIVLIEAESKDLEENMMGSTRIYEKPYTIIEICTNKYEGIISNIKEEIDYEDKIERFVDNAAGTFCNIKKIHCKRTEKKTINQLRKYYRLVAEGVEKFPDVIEDNLAMLARFGRYIASHSTQPKKNQELFINSLESILNTREW